MKLSAPIALAAVLATSQAAAAEDLIVESHGPSRPGEADSLLAPVVGALAGGGFASPAASAERIEARHSIASAVLDADQQGGARRFIDSGFQQFQEGNFRSALKDAGRGLKLLDSAPATLIEHPEQRDVRQRGLITLALANKRLGEEQAAREAAAELIRSFPDKPIDTAVYSPEAIDLVGEVRRELASRGAATLTVKPDDPSAVVFINEIYAGVGEIEKAGLVPGTYRVALRRGEEIGRLHPVAAQAGERRRLEVSWDLDQALSTAGGRLELRFPSEQARAAREGELARELARAAGAGRVVVLAVREHEGRRSVVGTVYAPGSEAPRGAFVTAEPTLPDERRLAALGRYLGGDEEARAMIEPLGGDPAAPPLPGPEGGGPGVFGWATVGLGALALGAGGVLIAIHEPERDGEGRLQPTARETRTAGIITAAAGAAVLGVGLYLILRGGDEKPPASALHVQPTEGGVALGFSTRF